MPSIEKPALQPCRVTGLTPARLLLGTLVVAISLGVVNVASVGAASQSQDGQGSAASPAGDARVGRPDPATVAKLLTKSRNAPLRVIVEFEIGGTGQGHRPEAALTAAEASAQRQAIQQVRSGVLARLGRTDYADVKTYGTLPLVALEVGPAALRRLAGDPDVMRIQEDVAVPPNLAESIPLIGADVAWAGGHTGTGWTVAILDTGVDGDHPFLAGKVVAEACYSTTASNARSLCPGGVSESTARGSGRNCPAQISGCDHGTHVAGIAAGTRRAFSGVAHDAGLIAIQVFSRFSGADCTDFGLSSPCVLTFPSDQMLALERVLELRRRFDIAAVNMSLGGGAFSGHCDNDLLKLAIDNLRAADIATVVSSGNNGFDGMVSAPACISSAIAVGSTTKGDRVWRFSNHAEIVDLLAPGSRIRSSVPGSRFAVKDGTSFAAPHVAGAFAVLRSADRSATVDQVEATLAITGRQLRRAGIAKPRIQVDAAVAALLEASGRPLNDDLANAILLAGDSGSVIGSNLAATAQAGEPTHAGVGGGSSVWWRWRAPQSGRATLSTFGSDYDSVLAVYTGPGVRRLMEVASNNDSAGLLQSEVEFAATAGTLYRIAVDGSQGAEGNIVLNYASVGASATNDNFDDAIALRGPADVTTGSTIGATAEPGEPRHAGTGGGRSVWWQWRVPASGDTIIATLGSDFDTVLAVYRGGSVGALREIASNDDAPGLGVQSMVRFNAAAGVLYRIAVDGFRGAEGNVTLMFANLAGLPPLLAASHGAPANAAERLWSAVAGYARAD
jgi:subtilisin family serine protease